MSRNWMAESCAKCRATAGEPCWPTCDQCISPAQLREKVEALQAEANVSRVTMHELAKLANATAHAAADISSRLEELERGRVEMTGRIDELFRGRIAALLRIEELDKQVAALQSRSARESIDHMRFK